MKPPDDSCRTAALLLLEGFLFWTEQKEKNKLRQLLLYHMLWWNPVIFHSSVLRGGSAAAPAASAPSHCTRDLTGWRNLNADFSPDKGRVRIHSRLVRALSDAVTKWMDQWILVFFFILMLLLKKKSLSTSHADLLNMIWSCAWVFFLLNM